MQLNVQMMSILDRFSGRPALADRRPIPKSNSDRERMGVELLSRYNVLTYGELRRRVEAVSVQLCKQAGRGSLRSGDRAALLGYPGSTSRPSILRAISSALRRFRYRRADR